MTQLRLRLRDSGEKRATERLAAVSRYSMEAVRWEIRAVAGDLKEFTSDDVWFSLKQATRDAFALAPNAFGAAFTAAARHGEIKATNQTVVSQRETGRGRRIMLWRRGPRYG